MGGSQLTSAMKGGGGQKLTKCDVKMSGGWGELAKDDVNFRMKNQFYKIRSEYCLQNNDKR